MYAIVIMIYQPKKAYVRKGMSSLSVSSSGRQARSSFVLIEVHLSVLPDSPIHFSRGAVMLTDIKCFYYTDKFQCKQDIQVAVRYYIECDGAFGSCLY